MFVRFLLMAALTVATPGPASDVELVDEAIELLERELELVPLAAPGNADAADVEQHRRELRAVEMAGAEVLAELDGRGLPLTDAAVDTLRASTPGRAGSSPPPRPMTYATAILDLRDLSDDLADAASAPDTMGSPVPGADSDVRTTGLPIPIAIVGLVAVVTAGWALLRRRERHLDDAIDQAMVDPLTSVHNRRRLERDLSAHDVDEHSRVAVLMVDIDHFKLINDEHGHHVGDSVLREVGAVLPEVVRGDDVVYRYGGEEFCVLLPGATLDEARATGERLRSAIGRIEVPGGGAISASVGVAEGVATSTRSAIVRADQALYAAKGAGRDRIEISREPVA